MPYRESIRKSCKAQGRHKKQTGGHGQFGDVWIQFEPVQGEAIEFAENVFGGSVPKNFFPAVEKGVRQAAEHGVLAGYPMVGMKATLLDGSYHPVDSSEMAFIMAAKIAYKAAIPEAGPVLLAHRRAAGPCPGGQHRRHYGRGNKAPRPRAGHEPR